MDGTNETVSDIRGDYITMNKNLGFSYQINEAFVNNVTNGHHDQHHIMFAPLRDGNPQIVVLPAVQVGEEVGEGKELPLLDL